jgi:hypothetical protein
VSWNQARYDIELEEVQALLMAGTEHERLMRAVALAIVELRAIRADLESALSEDGHIWVKEG